MAIYHMSMSNISRGKKQSAIASASYRSGEKLYSERYNKTSFYPREVQPVSYILKPEHAPEWTLNRERLWNEVEAVEKSSRARLAKEITVALPIELTNEQQENLVREYVQENFVDNGMVADVAIHRDNKENPHAHVMLTNRPFLENGEWGAKARRELLKDENGQQLYYESGDKKSRKISTTNWNDKSTLKKWRKNWADTTNEYLERAGYTERITEKSYADLGIDKKPTIHEGYVARSMEKNGKVSDRCETNRQIKKENYDKQNERQTYIDKEMKQNISKSLSPKEKTRLSSLVKSLGVYINFDNLIDKTRMVNNWNNKIKFNQIIKPDQDFSEVLSKIDDTKESIQEASTILRNQHLRVFEKYYPEINEKYNISEYKKIYIASKTLEKDDVLASEEFNQALTTAQDNELNYRMKEIIKNPSGNYSVSNLQKSLAGVNKQIDLFYKEHGISSKDEISMLDEPTQKKAQQLFSRQNTQFNLLNTLNKYYGERILVEYPTAEDDIDNLSIREKETVVNVMKYYGNEYSFDKLLDIAQDQIPNKYTRTEQQIGMKLIYKLDNNQMTDNDYELLDSNPDIKEIFDTIQDPQLRKQFLKEYQDNNPSENGMYSTYLNTNNEGLDYSLLANSLNIVNTLSNANIDNIIRENQAKKQERESKKKKYKRGKKEKQKYKNRGI